MADGSFAANTSDSTWILAKFIYAIFVKWAMVRCSTSNNTSVVHTDLTNTTFGITFTAKGFDLPTFNSWLSSVTRWAITNSNMIGRDTECISTACTTHQAWIVTFTTNTSFVIWTVIVGSATNHTIPIVTYLSKWTIGVDDTFASDNDLLTQPLGITTKSRWTGAQNIVIDSFTVRIEATCAEQVTSVLTNPVNTRFFIWTIGISSTTNDTNVSFTDFTNWTIRVPFTVV